MTVCACIVRMDETSVFNSALLVVERDDVILVPVTHRTAHYSHSHSISGKGFVCFRSHSLACSPPSQSHSHSRKLNLTHPNANATRSTRVCEYVCKCDAMNRTNIIVSHYSFIYIIVNCIALRVCNCVPVYHSYACRYGANILPVQLNRMHEYAERLESRA